MCARHVRETKVAGARVTMMAALFAFVAITRTRGAEDPEAGTPVDGDGWETTSGVN